MPAYQGDTSTLPEMAAPPAPVVEVSPASPTATPEGLIIVPGVLVLTPPAPETFSATANCQILDLGGGLKSIAAKTDVLSWSSVANATGSKVYVSGVEQQDLAAGITSTNFNSLRYSVTGRNLMF